MKSLEKPLTTEQIIKKVGGADKTDGSCVSVALAYAGNANGFDVTDFRGGESMGFFSKTKNINELAQILNGKIVKNTNDFKAVTELLKSVDNGKEYLLGTGEHGAIIRRNNGIFEYLELQSENENGFKKLTTYALKERFLCKKSHSIAGFKLEQSNTLIDISEFKDNNEIKKILGYINTTTENQLKGKGGGKK